MRPPTEDYYALLGVRPEATVAELRRAYRKLALAYHPDRAGAESTTVFQRITEAYEVLTDARRRAAYDGYGGGRRSRWAEARHGSGARETPERGDGFEAGAYEGPGGYFNWSRRRAPRVAPRIDRLCGLLSELVAAGRARALAEGWFELLLVAEEAIRGGRVALDADVVLTCPTCSGLAEKHVLWCRRCEYAGRVEDRVCLELDLRPGIPDGTVFSFVTDTTGATPPVRLRVRVGDSRP